MAGTHTNFKKSFTIVKNKKKLNNFAAELLHISNISKSCTECTFSNPKNGWIFIQLGVKDMYSVGLRLTIDTVSIEESLVVNKTKDGKTLEAMRFLPAGDHRIDIWCEKGPCLKSITIRSIPELIYSRYGYEPKISEFGPYNWDFLKRNIFNNINVMTVTTSKKPLSLYMKSWKEHGKNWIGLNDLKKVYRSSSICNYWTKDLNDNPYLDGIIVDEFGPKPKFRVYYENCSNALKRVSKDVKFKDKRFYAYIYSDLPSQDLYGSMWEKQWSRYFVQTIMDCNYKISWERYFHEQSTEEKAWGHLERYLKKPMITWRQAQRGIEKNLIINLGLFSAPPLSLNIFPYVNYRVFLDMQVNMLANDSAFSDIYGLMFWTSAYADEETIRWTGKLFRHYCIEGKTEMLSEDPYLLTHVVNSDFKQGTAGWTIVPAEKGSIKVKTYRGFGKYLGHWHPEFEDDYYGDTSLWMKRSKQKPNIFSQKIHNLQPGRLYSLKIFTTDYNDLINKGSKKRRHAININIEGVDEDEGKGVQHIYSPGQQNSRKDLWINYHWKLFRARAKTAMLLISDWATKENPGGPIGQELIYNFIEVQPYLEK